MHTSYLNKMLDQSLFILDLLPRSAAPILIILSDSNLFISRLGKYNNILMQLNRVDININFIDIFNSSGNENLYTLGLVSNKSIMSHICKFTGGMFLTEEKISEILNTKIFDNKIKLPFCFSNTKKQSFLNPEESLSLLDITNNNLRISIDNLEENKLSVNSSLSENKLKFGENKIQIKCKNCENSIYSFFCKKPYQDKIRKKDFALNNQALKNFKKTNPQFNFSLFFIDEFKRYKDVKIIQKETVTL